MDKSRFWQMFTRGEIYLIRGELVELVSYDTLYDQGVFKDGDGNRVTADPGLIRLITNTA